MDVILNTYVSTINDLIALVLSELENELHFVAARYTDE